MKNSKDRLLTTHAGSLVRPASIVVAMRAKEAGEPYDEQALAADARTSVAEVVRHQAEAGVDIPSDGEQAKASFFRYLNDRLTGLTPTRLRPDQGGLQVTDLVVPRDQHGAQHLPHGTSIPETARLPA